MKRVTWRGIAVPGCRLAGCPRPCATLPMAVCNVVRGRVQRCPWACATHRAASPHGKVPSRRVEASHSKPHGWKTDAMKKNSQRVKKNSHCVKTFLHGICFSASKPLTSGCGVGRAAAKAHFARQAEGNEAVAPFCAKKSAHCTALKRAIRAKCLTLHHLRWVLFIPTV